MFAALAIKDKLTRASRSSREEKIKVLVEVFESDFPKLGVDESWSEIAGEALALLQAQTSQESNAETGKPPFEIDSYKSKLRVTFNG